MPEPKQTTLDTLAEMLAEYKRTIENKEKELVEQQHIIRNLEDRLADCEQQKNPAHDYDFHSQRVTIQELEKELGELKNKLTSARAECKHWGHRETELRKEKEHYKQVAQQAMDDKKNYTYERGMKDGHAVALAEAQDAILKLRK